MADERNELTEEGGPDPKGKGKKKALKEKALKEEAPKQPKSGKEKKEKEPKAPKGERKKLGKLKLILIIVLAVLIIAAACGAVIYLNLFGVGDIVFGTISDWLLSLIVWVDPNFSSVDEELRSISDAREEDLNAREEGLNKRQNDFEEELTKREEDANNREKQLDRREAAVEKRAQEVEKTWDMTTPLFRRVLTDEELSDLNSLSRSYSQMAPETAAEILVELYDPMDAATILYYMTERNAAAILSEMEVENAVVVTEILLGNTGVLTWSSNILAR